MGKSAIHKPKFESTSLPSSTLVKFEDVKNLDQSIHDTILGYIKHFIGYKDDIPTLVHFCCVLYYNNMRYYDPTVYRVPRNIKLIMELEDAEKGRYGDVKKYGYDCLMVTIGLDYNTCVMNNDKGYDISYWNASIIPRQHMIGDRIYYLKMEAPWDYPQDPPIVRYVHKVKMPCVDDRGFVLFDKMKTVEWTSQKCMFEVILALREEMCDNKVERDCCEIPSGTKYPEFI